MAKTLLYSERVLTPPPNRVSDTVDGRSVVQVAPMAGLRSMTGKGVRLPNSIDCAEGFVVGML